MPRRRLRIGHLHVRGAEATFTAEPVNGLSLRRGDELEVELAYTYEEVALGDETCGLTFRVALHRTPLGAAQRRLVDTPLIRDRKRGTLSHVGRVEVDGPLDVFFSIEAEYVNRPRIGNGRGSGADFRHEGRVTIPVR